MSKTRYIVSSLIIILGFVGLTVMHEGVHVAINNNYGISSRTEYFSHFPDAVTIAEDECPKDTMCNFAHDLNEIIGYPLQIVYFVLTMLWITNKNFSKE